MNDDHDEPRPTPASPIRRPLPDAEPPDALYARALALTIAENSAPQNKGWRIDRTLSPPVFLTLATLICGLAGYTWTGVTWANATTANAQEMAREMARLAVQIEAGDKRLLERSDERYRSITVRLEGLERDGASGTVRIARLEEQFRAVQESLGRIERKLDGRR